MPILLQHNEIISVCTVTAQSDGNFSYLYSILQAEKHPIYEAFARKERRFSSVESDLLRKLRPEMHVIAQARANEEYLVEK